MWNISIIIITTIIIIIIKLLVLDFITFFPKQSVDGYMTFFRLFVLCTYNVQSIETTFHYFAVLYITKT